MSDDAIRLLSAFSAAVLDIQRLAQSQPIEDFHDQMFTRLQALIAFDSAWWGRAALVDGIPQDHDSHLFHLPANYLADWQSISHDDVTIARVHQMPGHAAIIDMGTTPGLAWLGERHQIGQLMCVMVTDPVTRLSEHLTLYRCPGAALFEVTECALLDSCMPHLSAAVSANQIRALIAMRETLSRPSTLALAVCDGHGILHCAEPAFIELILSHWPGWVGPGLPITVQAGQLHCNHLLLDLSPVAGLFILTARAQTALQLLSPREYEVARGFGDGKTYKQVARDLGVAPNTVRHHIRSIYAKLGVQDKVGIAQLLRNDTD